MLIVSLRGINFGFWSHLGCSGQNAIIFSREGLVRFMREHEAVKNTKMSILSVL